MRRLRQWRREARNSTVCSGSAAPTFSLRVPSRLRLSDASCRKRAPTRQAAGAAVGHGQTGVRAHRRGPAERVQAVAELGGQARTRLRVRRPIRGQTRGVGQRPQRCAVVAVVPQEGATLSATPRSGVVGGGGHLEAAGPRRRGRRCRRRRCTPPPGRPAAGRARSRRPPWR